MDGFPPDVLSFTLLAPVQLSQVHPLLLSVRRATADQGFSGFMFDRSLAMSAPKDVLRSCINYYLLHLLDYHQNIVSF